MSRPIFIAPAIVSIEVFVPLTTSHSFMTLAGAKKCAPPTSCGRFVTSAMMSMSIAEELVSSIAPGFITASSFANTVLLHVDALEHRLDDDVAVGDVLVALAPAG